MRFEDALFNWLQIKIVAEGRPEDDAAKRTLDFFEEILREDHGLTRIAIETMDAGMILVAYDKDGETHTSRYPRELGEALLTDISSNPKYN
ncbi:MAG: hypothetical protein K0Q63_2881 [Paenibacillus sp.]|jgi:hypothetical protein|nr:hypothetical protein [Paenibacillus sp.]